MTQQKSNIAVIDNSFSHSEGSVSIEDSPEDKKEVQPNSDKKSYQAFAKSCLKLEPNKNMIRDTSPIS